MVFSRETWATVDGQLGIGVGTCDEEPAKNHDM